MSFWWLLWHPQSLQHDYALLHFTVIYIQSSLHIYRLSLCVQYCHDNISIVCVGYPEYFTTCLQTSEHCLEKAIGRKRHENKQSHFTLMLTKYFIESIQYEEWFSHWSLIHWYHFHGSHTIFFWLAIDLFSKDLKFHYSGLPIHPPDILKTDTCQLDELNICSFRILTPMQMALNTGTLPQPQNCHIVNQRFVCQINNKIKRVI